MVKLTRRNFLAASATAAAGLLAACGNNAGTPADLSETGEAAGADTSGDMPDDGDDAATQEAMAEALSGTA